MAPAEVLVQLAQALDVSADELLGLDKPKSKKTPKQDPETKRLWKKFQQLIDLPEKERRDQSQLLGGVSLLAPMSGPKESLRAHPTPQALRVAFQVCNPESAASPPTRDAAATVLERLGERETDS
jgi:hypothetical protein